METTLCDRGVPPREELLRLASWQRCWFSRCYTLLVDPRGQQPTGRLCPWGFPGKDAGCCFHSRGASRLGERTIEPLALQADSLLTEPPGKPEVSFIFFKN